jgi:hypothetical protein
MHKIKRDIPEISDPTQADDGAGSVFNIHAFIAMLGIGLFALPAGIIASGFASELQKQKPEKAICIYTGKDANSISE